MSTSPSTLSTTGTVAGTETVFLFVQYPGSAVANRGGRLQGAEGLLPALSAAQPGRASAFTIPLRVEGPQVLGHDLRATGTIEPGTGEGHRGAERRRGVAACTAAADRLLALRHVHGQLTTTRRTNDEHTCKRQPLTRPFAVGSPRAVSSLRLCSGARAARRSGAERRIAVRRAVAAGGAEPPVARRSKPAPASRRPSRRPNGRRGRGSSSSSRRRPIPSRSSAASTAARCGSTCRACSGRTCPRIGVGISGYGWVDTQLPADRIGDPGQLADHYTELFEQGRFAAARDADLHRTAAGSCRPRRRSSPTWIRYDVQPAPGVVVDTDDVWVRTGHLEHLGRHGRTVPGLRRLSPGHGPGSQHLRTHSAPSIPVHGNPTGPAPCRHSTGASYLFYRPPAPAGTSRSTSIRSSTSRVELLGQWGNDGAENYLGAPARRSIFDVGWLKLRAPPSTSTKFARGSRGDRQEHHPRTAAGPAPCSSSSRPCDRARPERRRTQSRRRRRAAPDGRMANTALSGNRLSYGGFIDVVPLPMPCRTSWSAWAATSPASTTCSRIRRRTRTRNRRTRNSSWPSSISFTAALLQGRGWLRQVALPEPQHRDSLRRRHVQRPRPPDVPLLLGP